MIQSQMILLAVIVGSLSISASYLKGRSDGRALEAGDNAVIQQAVSQGRESAAQVAAEAISKIKVVNTTIRQKSEVVTRESPVYRDCRHDPRVLQSINAALAGQQQIATDRQLPAADRSR